MNPRFALLTLVIALLPTTPLQADDPKIRDFIWAFEQRLHAWPKDKLQERDQAVREFFAGLKDAPTKIAAIGMTDSRYVYVIPRPLVSELMGKLLADPDLSVRLRAARSLGYNGKAGDHFDAIIALRKEVDDARLDAVLYAMGRSGDARFVPHLREALKHKEGSIRARAVFEMSRFPRRQVHDDLMALWNDPHEQVRYNLLSFVAHPATEEGVDRLMQRLEDKSERVRQGAVEHLGRSTQPGMAKVVAKMLGDPHPHVRGKAIEALGNLEAREYLDVIVQRFCDVGEHHYVRRMALVTFERMPDARYLPRVRDMLRDEDVQMREHAVRIAGALTKGQETLESYEQ